MINSKYVHNVCINTVNRPVFPDTTCAEFLRDALKYTEPLARLRKGDTVTVVTSLEVVYPVEIYEAIVKGEV
jgi:hypothetical protein